MDDHPFPLFAAGAAALPQGFFWAFAFVFGANVGSFLNVVAHRLPMGLSVVRPRSRCPACRAPIGALDNVPVLSWILLRGRCRGCKGRISIRYPAVETFAGLLAVLVVHCLVTGPGRIESGHAWAHATVVFAATAALLAASLIDYDHTILPDEVSIPGMWVAPVAAAAVPELTLGPGLDVPSWLPWTLDVRLAAALLSVLGIVVGAGIVWGIRAAGSAILRKEAMGFGDVKFHGAIGGFTGPVGALLALVFASLVGAAVGAARMIVTKNRYLPFGPCLAFGGFVVMLKGHAFIEWYLGLLRG